MVNLSFKFVRKIQKTLFFDVFWLFLRRLRFRSCNPFQNDNLIIMGNLFDISWYHFVTFNPSEPPSRHWQAAFFVVHFMCKKLWRKTYTSVRISERGPLGARASIPCGMWYHFPSCGAEMLCRSRPLKRQWVTAQAVTRVEPWNTFVSHPWFFRGWEFFIFWTCFASFTRPFKG